MYGWVMKSISFIRSFHLSILLGVLPQCGTLLHSPLFLAEPKMLEQEWATDIGALSGKWGFGAMRDENDLPLDVWSHFFQTGIFKVALYLRCLSLQVPVLGVS